MRAMPGYTHMRVASSHTDSLRTPSGAAGAAKLIAENGWLDAAAVASRRAGELYGLNVLDEDIQVGGRWGVWLGPGHTADGPCLCDASMLALPARPFHSLCSRYAKL
jgi:hypothetical protein